MSRNGRRRGFIVACASHQKKDRRGSAAQLNSILVQSYSLTDQYIIRFCLVLTLGKCFFFCIDIFFSVAMTKTLNQHLKQWQPAPTVSSLSLNSVRIVSRYI